MLFSNEEKKKKRERNRLFAIEKENEKERLDGGIPDCRTFYQKKNSFFF